MAPTLLPWMGYFDMINKSDVFVYLDSVQFNKRSWQQRNRIPKDENYLWITIPVKTKGKYNQLIKEVEIDYSKDPFDDLMKTFEYNYIKSENYYEVINIISKIFKKKINFLCDLNIMLITAICNFLKIKNKIFLKSSTLNISSNKGQLLFDITKKLGGDTYLSADGSEIFFKEQNPFVDSGINLHYQKYTHPIYKQRTKNFLDYCSVIDLLFNEGENSKNFFKI